MDTILVMNRLQVRPNSELWSIVRVLFCVAVAFASAGGQQVSAQTETSGRVSGTVRNGTTGEIVRDVQVTLSRFERVGPESVDIIVTADAEGRFTFDGLDASDGFVFAASVRYQRVLYSTGMIRLSQEAEQDVEIVVYESTADDSTITMSARGIVVSAIDTDAGIVTITDLSVVANGSSRTFIGDDDGRTVRFHVPGNAIQVTPRGGFDFTNAMIEDATVFTVAPLRPGDVDATLEYTLPYAGRSVRFPIQASYPTDIVRILVPADAPFDDVILRVDGHGIIDEGIVGIESSDYHIWSISEVGAGQTIDVTISNLPATNVVHNELQPLLPGVIAFSVFALAAGLTGAVIVRRGLQKQRPVVIAQAPSATLDERRTELADHLRTLEARWSEGDLDESEYRLARTIILEDLRRISRQARGLGDDEQF